MKKLGLVALIILLLLIGVVAVGNHLILDKIGPESVPRDLALQDDSKVVAPVVQPAANGEAPSSGGELNLYWGELHLHTAESFDSSMMGNKLGIEDAYRFAKGEPLIGAGGETMQLSRPLDFVAITDHAEGFGSRTHCDDPNLSLFERAACWVMAQDSPIFLSLIVEGARGEDEPGELSLPTGVYQPKARKVPGVDRFPTCKWGDSTVERCYDNVSTDWARYVQLADDYYEPGELTTLVAYEFSPGMPDQGKHHRNVIFRSNSVPERAISSIDVPNAIELWKGLEATCDKADGCDFLTMPHNPNKAWGLTYSRYAYDGKQYTEDDWRLRQRREPLTEIYQNKGASECALGVGATDEECAFAQVLDPCQPGETTGCAFETGFVRDGLKVGLELEQELGFNPLQIGFIAATDGHNANPGDVEEWDFRGTVGTISSPAVRRMSGTNLGDKAYRSMLKFHTPGGLAAVWAPENTREAIFDALARRETYATSGPRIGLRFYAGRGIDQAMIDAPDLVQHLEAEAVSMGAVLPSSQRPDQQSESPEFLVWAVRDPMDAPLQRLQMVKGWIDDAGQTHENVVDIACADGLQVDPATGRCPDNGASVDLSTCQYSAGSGATELKTIWRDPDYDQNQSAFYYVRVLMNPTCRWSSFDAIRLGREPDPSVPATIQERAWSSPIWAGGQL
ncbi:hypothetical protein GPB2148_3543 [marine gamma proteobacterium HTCC2148]|nr:hypothetical protein GPB2148_3543 [marine gamma proteobacterium HTCC2148]